MTTPPFFQIAIVQPDIERRKKLLGPLHFFAGCVFMLYAAPLVRHIGGQTMLYWTLTIVAAGLMAAFGIFGKKFFRTNYATVNTRMRWVETALYASLSVWSFASELPVEGSFLLLWGLFLVFMALSENRLYKPADVTITEQGIHIPTAGNGLSFGWDQVEEVLVKSDYLTILFPQNRFMQFEVAETFTEPELIKINEFCAGKALGRPDEGQPS